MHLDFHTPDFVENVGAGLDAERFTEVLAKGAVEQAAFFAKCHYGNSYYPTKIGRKHPGLIRDMLGDFTKSANKRGIKVFAYYSLQLDRWYGKEHPDTVQTGKPFAEITTGHWTAVCVNNHYGEYARKQIEEVVKAYDVAGIWLDIVGYYPFCLCQNCRASFVKDTGKPLPFDESKPENGVGKDYLDWQRKMLDDYTTSIAEMIRKIRPGNVLICNTSSGITEKSGGQTNRNDGQWVEESVGNHPVGLTNVSLYSGLFDNAAEPQPFEICTQRFHMGWGDWTLRPVEALKFDISTIFSHGGLPSIGDQLYGDGGFEPVVYERIGEAFRWLKKRQDFTGTTKNAAEIAIFGESNAFRSDPGAIYYNGSACKYGEGLFKVMLDAHIPAAILPSLNALSPKRHSLLLSDENLPDDDNSVNIITKFVESGGSLLSVGIPPKRYWGLLGIRNSEKLPFEVSYIKIPDPKDQDLTLPVLARLQGNKVTLDDKAQPVAYWAHPLCAKTNDVFYSHQHAPAGPVSKDPCIWETRYGKGRIIGIAAPIAMDYWHTSYQPLRKVIVGCVENLLSGKKQVYAENVAVNTEITIRKNGKSFFVNLIIPSISRPGMKQTGATFYSDEPVLQRGITLMLRLPAKAKCKSANQLGQALKVSSKKRDGYAAVSLKPFATHTVVRFDISKK